MDFKFLFLGLILISFDVFSAYASPVAGAEETIVKEDKELESEEDYQLEVQRNKVQVAKSIYDSYATKAKVLESTAKTYAQVTKDRANYYVQYAKEAETAKLKSKENEQKAVAESATIEGTENRRKDWETKSREAENQSKEQQVMATRYRAEAQDWSRRMEAASVAAAVAEAQASGAEKIANSEKEWAMECKGRADELLNNAARSHFTKAKEAEQKATAEKIKAQQQAEEAQKRFQAAKALQEQSLKAEISSQENLARYIALIVQAEEARNYAKEDEVAASMEELMSSELSKRAQQAESIAKILEDELKFYRSRAKKEESRAMVYTQSAREVNSAAISQSASALQMAHAKESDEPEDIDPAMYPVHQMKNMAYVSHKMID